MRWPYVTIGITAVVAIVTWFIQNIPIEFKIAITILILIAVVSQVFTLRAQQHDKQLLKYFGALKGPAVMMLSLRQEILPKLKLGNSNTFLVWRRPAGESLLKLLGITKSLFGLKMES